jgi:hypothetical protein
MVLNSEQAGGTPLMNRPPPRLLSAQRLARLVYSAHAHQTIHSSAPILCPTACKRLLSMAILNQSTLPDSDFFVHLVEKIDDINFNA